MALSKKQIRLLKEVRRYLEMRDCRFMAPEKWPCPGNWPERGEDFTKAVIEATKLWRDTWILPVLDELIADKTNVQCSICRKTKKPLGRSAPLMTNLCDQECPGYYLYPKPSRFWPGEE